MIELTGATVVGEGCRRIVYVHPEDAGRCIKVQTPEARSQAHRQKALQREIHYLQFYERKGRAMDQVSRYLGEVATSAGEGQVFELVRDHGGAISPTLAAGLEAGVVTLLECRAELEDLKAYLMREGLIVADLHAGNLAWQEWKPGCHRLVVIDGLGNTEFLKVNDYLRVAARRKVERKWSRFRRDLESKWGTA